VPPLLVTPEARRSAKAVNFGIVYGISPFGLAAQLGFRAARRRSTSRIISRATAGCAALSTKPSPECGRRALAGRCSGASVHTRHQQPQSQRARFAERTAVNTPLQGTAADLIKLAMVRIDAALEAGGHRSAMLLQVHDELVFECPPEDVDTVSRLVKREMEGVRELKGAADGGYRRG